MAGAITQDPMGIGRCTLQSAVDAVNGKKMDAVQDTGSFWYDKSNVNSDEIKPKLYQ